MKRFFLTGGLLLSLLQVLAADVYVAPSGKDSNDGSQGAPKATLTSALRQAREMRRLSAPGLYL